MLHMHSLNDFGITRDEVTLTCGAKLALYYKPNAPIYMEARFHAGTRYEPADKPGLAHFSEHILVAGSKKFPTKYDMAVYFEKFGGNFGAATGNGEMYVHFSLADATDFHEAAIVLNEMLSHRQATDKIFEGEKGSVLQEIKRGDANPAHATGSRMNSLKFQGTDLGRVILGTTEAVREFTPAEADSFLNDFLSSSRLTITLSGDIQIDEAKKILDSYLEMPAQERFKASTSDLPVKRETYIKIVPFTDTDNINIVLGFRAPKFGQPENLALMMIDDILGHGRTASLIKLLRQERGLVYGASSVFYNYSDAGYFVIGTSCAKKNLDEVLSVIGSELTRIRTKGVTEEEFNLSKTRRLKSVKMGMQTSRSWVEFHSRREAFDLGTTLVDQLNELEGLTVSDVNKTAANNFNPRSWYLGLAGNIKENEVKFDY
jgi:predicted Zn-dependent peptidase